MLYIFIVFFYIDYYSAIPEVENSICPGYGGGRSESGIFRHLTHLSDHGGIGDGSPHYPSFRIIILGTMVVVGEIIEMEGFMVMMLMDLIKVFFIVPAIFL